PPAAALEALLAALLDAPAQPVLLEALGPPARLLVGYAGTAAEVDFAVAEASRIAQKVLGFAGETAVAVPWEGAHAEALAAHRGGEDAALTLRLHVPSSHVAALLEQVAKDAAAGGVPCRYAVHAAVGIARVHLGGASEQALQSLVENWLSAARRRGGNLVVERAPLPLKRALPVWGEPPPALFLMRALKEKFDPHRILNPGRYVGGM
ncbi:MAG TPA: FAD-linked oxidase C-terminal domain-containing protein, partial [Limnochordales bacterium]